MWGVFFLSYLPVRAGILRGVYANFPPAVACRFILYSPVNQGIQGIVTTNANIVTRLYSCTTLPYQYRPCVDHLPGVSFDAESLSLAVATILGTSTTFFMCHFRSPLRHPGQLLPG